MQTDNIKYAPEIDHLISQIERRGGISGSEICKCQERRLMEQIGEELSILDDSDDDTNITLWFTAERGSIEQWKSYEEAVDYEEVESREEYQKLWLDYYPDEIKFYEFCYRKHGDFIGIFLGERGLLESRQKLTEDEPSVWADYIPLLQWTLEQVRITIQQILAGEYDSFIKSNLPYYYRTGTIARRDLWQIEKDRKKFDLAGWKDELLTDEEICIFKQLVEEQKSFNDDDFILEGMTAAKYFAYCRIGYEANKIAQCRDFDADVDLYKCLADGRDDGLTNIDLNSPEEFIRWKSGELQVFNGHHPWEVLRGGNSTHVNFGVTHRGNVKDGRFYLYLAGLHRPGEVIRFFIALRQHNIMVELEDMDELLARCLGTDRVGIVPNGVFPRYCEGMFPGEKVVDFMNIHHWEENYAEIVEKASWHEIDTPKPVKKTITKQIHK